MKRQKKRIVELLERGDYVDLEPVLRTIWSEETLARAEEEVRRGNIVKWSANARLWSSATVRFIEVDTIIARNVRIPEGVCTGIEFLLDSTRYPLWLPSDMVVELIEMYDEDEEIT